MRPDLYLGPFLLGLVPVLNVPALVPGLPGLVLGDRRVYPGTLETKRALVSSPRGGPFFWGGHFGNFSLVGPPMSRFFLATLFQYSDQGGLTIGIPRNTKPVVGSNLVFFFFFFLYLTAHKRTQQKQATEKTKSTQEPQKTATQRDRASTTQAAA